MIQWKRIDSWWRFFANNSMKVPLSRLHFVTSSNYWCVMMIYAVLWLQCLWIGSSRRGRINMHSHSASVLIQWPLLLPLCSWSSTSMGEAAPPKEARLAQQPNPGARCSVRHWSLGETRSGSSAPLLPRLRVFLVRLLARAVLSGYTFLWKIWRICKWAKSPFRTLYLQCSIAHDFCSLHQNYNQ